MSHFHEIRNKKSYVSDASERKLLWFMVRTTIKLLLRDLFVCYQRSVIRLFCKLYIHQHNHTAHRTNSVYVLLLLVCLFWFGFVFSFYFGCFVLFVCLIVCLYVRACVCVLFYNVAFPFLPFSLFREKQTRTKKGKGNKLKPFPVFYFQETATKNHPNFREIQWRTINEKSLCFVHFYLFIWFPEDYTP